MRRSCLHKVDPTIAFSQFERGQELSEVLLRPRQVHLVKQDYVEPVLVGLGLGAIYRLQRVALVVALLKGVVVAQEIGAISPAGLHRDRGANTSHSLGEGSRQARLAGATDPLQDMQLAHGKTT